VKKEEKQPDISDVIGGTLNIFGLKVDLAKLLSSPEDVKGGLEQLREKLKKAGGKELMSDEEWKSSGGNISGHLRTSGVLGDREYHVGTTAPPIEPVAKRKRKEKAPEPPEAVEPAVDVFREAKEIIVLAEVPGVELADLELKVEDNVLSLASKSSARRNYRKKVKLGSPVDESSLKASCRNGILEIRLQKKT